MELSSSGSHNHGRSKSSSKKIFNYYQCGKKEHIKKDCWHYKKSAKKAPEATNSQGCVASTSDNGENYVVKQKLILEEKGSSMMFGSWIQKQLGT